MNDNYRKKPVIISAVQFLNTAESLAAISDFSGQTISVDYAEPEFPYLKIETLEGVMTASPGDWIIRGVKNELYPCKPDIFEATYEKVEG